MRQRGWGQRKLFITNKKDLLTTAMRLTATAKTQLLTLAPCASVSYMYIALSVFITSSVVLLCCDRTRCYTVTKLQQLDRRISSTSSGSEQVPAKTPQSRRDIVFCKQLDVNIHKAVFSQLFSSCSQGAVGLWSPFPPRFVSPPS